MLNPFNANRHADEQSAVDIKFRRDRVSHELLDSPLVLQVFTEKRRAAETRRRELIQEIKNHGERSRREFAALERKVIAAREALDAAELALPRLRREYYSLNGQAEGLQAGIWCGGTDARGRVIVRELEELADKRISRTIAWLQELLASARQAVDMWPEVERTVVEPKSMYDPGGIMERRGFANNLTDIQNAVDTLGGLLSKARAMLISDYGADPIDALREIEPAALTAVKPLTGGDSPEKLFLGDVLAA